MLRSMTALLGLMVLTAAPGGGSGGGTPPKKRFTIRKPANSPGRKKVQCHQF